MKTGTKTVKLDTAQAFVEGILNDPGHEISRKDAKMLADAFVNQILSIDTFEEADNALTKNERWIKCALESMHPKYTPVNISVNEPPHPKNLPEKANSLFKARRMAKAHVKKLLDKEIKKMSPITGE